MLKPKTTLMKQLIALASSVLILASCNTSVSKNETLPSTVPSSSATALEGTWKLIQATIIEKGDTTVTDYSTNKSFIKIINKSHFAFLQHDLNKGKDSTAAFVAGGGAYNLKDSTYTEHLEYCSAREWEGNDFIFTVTITKDTLVQQGIEKIESAGVNRINIEKYVRVK